MTTISTLDWIKFMINAGIPNTSIVVGDLNAKLIAGEAIVINDDNDSSQMFNIDNIQEFAIASSTPEDNFYSSREISQ